MVMPREKRTMKIAGKSDVEDDIYCYRLLLVCSSELQLELHAYGLGREVTGSKLLFLFSTNELGMKFKVAFDNEKLLGRPNAYFLVLLRTGSMEYLWLHLRSQLCVRLLLVFRHCRCRLMDKAFALTAPPPPPPLPHHYHRFPTYEFGAGCLACRGTCAMEKL